MSKLRPVNGNVIIRPIEEEEQMSGNIIIPDMGKERPEMGEIVAISKIYYLICHIQTNRSLTIPVIDF